MGRVVLLLVASHFIAFGFGVYFCGAKYNQEIEKLRKLAEARRAAWIEEIEKNNRR